MILRDPTVDEVRAFCEAVGVVPTFNFRGVGAFGEDGRMLAMLGFDRWTPNSVYMHALVLVPVALRRLVPEAARYIFGGKTPRKLLYAEVNSDNVKSLRLMEKLGFKQVAVLEDAVVDGIDKLVFRMTVNDCGWV